MVGGDGKKRAIYLFSPSLAKLVQIAVWEDHNVDLGSIARVFELDPTSLKLNGHFIARGVDFIASSVTWRSLLSFFSARGLSTGATVSDVLIVDGKVSKLGSKRMHDPTDSMVEDCNADYHLIKSDGYPNKKLFFQDTVTSYCKTRSKARDSGFNDEMNEPMKKLKLSLANSGNQEDTKDGRVLGITVSSGEYSWGFDKNMKRIREEDNLDLANSNKRTSNQEDTKDGRALGITVSSGEYSCGFDKNMKRTKEEDNLDLANSNKRSRV